jgi:hypothetical protein
MLLVLFFEWCFEKNSKKYSFGNVKQHRCLGTSQAKWDSFIETSNMPPSTSTDPPM